MLSVYGLVMSLAAALVMLPVASSAFAAGAMDHSCYQRSYSANELKAHPEQTVTYILAGVAVGYVSLNIFHRGDTEEYSGDFECSDAGECTGVQYTYDSNGKIIAVKRENATSFNVQARDDGKFVITNRGWITLYGNDVRTSLSNTPQGDDVFVLSPTDSKYCAVPMPNGL